MFREIKNFEGYYSINENGVVKSLDRYVNHPKGGFALKKGKIIKSATNGKTRYKTIVLFKDGKDYNFLIHRLVAIALVVLNGNIKMSISSEITRLQTAKDNIKTAVENKGITIGSSVKIDNYPTYINQIQTFDPYNGHDYVEISGLKWATMNIGANSVTDYGQYFQWGDTTGYEFSQVGASSTANKKPFAWADYKFGNGTSSPDASGMTKYNENDGKTALDMCDDAARANWGGSWRIPTTAEYQTLFATIDFEWVSDYQGSSTSGIVLTDKVDSSKVLFLPTIGFCYDGIFEYVGSYGLYWQSSLDNSNITKAFNLLIGNGFKNLNKTNLRRCGFPIRPVIN